MFLRRPTKEVGTLPQWRLMWRQFRRHRLALAGMAILVPVYFVAIFAEFFAPMSSATANTSMTYAPPQVLRFSGDLGLYVHGYRTERDPKTYEQRYTEDPGRRIDVGLFVHGDEYELLGLIPSDLHLIGPVTKGDPVFLLGSDQNGRDLLSRLIHGARVSLSIGLVGVAASFLLGMLIGGISGYFGAAWTTPCSGSSSS